MAGTGRVRDAVPDRILDQGLKYKTRHDRSPGLFVDMKLDIQTFFVTPAFNVEIELHHL